MKKHFVISMCVGLLLLVALFSSVVLSQPPPSGCPPNENCPPGMKPNPIDCFMKVLCEGTQITGYCIICPTPIY